MADLQLLRKQQPKSANISVHMEKENIEDYNQILIAEGNKKKNASHDYTNFPPGFD